MLLIPGRTLLLGLALGCWGATAPAADFELKLAHYVPPTHHHFRDMVPDWIRRIETQSQGRIKITVYPSQQLLKANEIYDGLRNGVADMGLVFAGTTPGRFPIISIADLPFLFPSSTVGSRAVMELANTGALDKEWADTKILYFNTLELGTFHIRNKTINSLADLKGVRIRFPTTAIRDLMSAYGAVPVGVPTAQIYEFLEKGTIDGAAVGWDALLSLRVGELTNQHVDLPIFTLALCTCMSRKTFERMPADLQKIIMDNSRMAEWARVGGSYDRSGKAGYDWAAKQGHTISKPKDEAAWRAAAQPVIEAHLKGLEDKGIKAREYYKFLVDAAAR